MNFITWGNEITHIGGKDEKYVQGSFSFGSLFFFGCHNCKCARCRWVFYAASIGQTDVDLPGFDDDTSFTLGLGYSFNKNFAIEASYIDFGESSDDIIPVWTLSADGLQLAAVGKIPFNEQFSGFAKFGFLSWDAELEEAGFGQIASDDGTDVTFGFGAMFDATEKVSFNLLYQMYELDDVDVDNLSLGIQVGF